MSGKEYPIPSSLADEVVSLHGTDRWEAPWNKIRKMYPELESHRGNMILFIDDDGVFTVKIKEPSE